MSQEIPQIQKQSVGGAQQPTQYGGGQGMGAGVSQAVGQGTGQTMGQQPGPRFEDTMTSEMRVALHDFVEAATICNWCADECLGDMQMEECARLCRDVADLASLNIQLISRDSVFGTDVAETFAHAAQACQQECARHPHEHCQECAAVLSRAVVSTWEMLNSFQGAGQTGLQQGQAQLQQGQTQLQQY